MLLAVVAGVVAVVFVGVYYLASGKDQEAKLRLKSTPWADIGEAPTGVDIRLSGRLALLNGESITAPMSGRTCAAWRIVIQEEHREGRLEYESPHWETLVDESESIDFVLDDDTGRARVETTDFVLVADFDEGGGAETLRELPERLAAALKERGVHASWWSRERNYRYRESALEVGELVTVAGSGRWENDPSQRSGYRGTDKIFRIGPLEKGGTVVAADDLHYVSTPKRSSLLTD